MEIQLLLIINALHFTIIKHKTCLSIYKINCYLANPNLNVL